jgi:hypothetical protein
MSAAFDEGGTSGLLLNNLRCLDDTSQLVLDSNTIVQPQEPAEWENTGRAMVDITDLRGMCVE